MSVKVDKRGPIFDGTLEAAVNAATESAERRVALLGASMVRTRLNSVLRRQTPYYRFKVVVKEDAPGWKITDQGVIYGPWLEGIGSRNAPVTRFKGYHTFKLITKELQGRANVIAQDIVAKYLG